MPSSKRKPTRSAFLVSGFKIATIALWHWSQSSCIKAALFCKSFIPSSKPSAPEAIKAGDLSKKFLKEYEKRVKDDMGHDMEKYGKAADYLLELSDDELNDIAHAFQDVEFTKISTTQIVKALVKISPKAALKLRKFF